MIDTMWVAQAAQSGDVAGVGASDFFGNTAQMLENGFTLIVSLFASFFLTVVNIALFYEIHDDTKDGCGCGACRVLGLFLSAVGVVVNAVASALAARAGRFTGSFVEISRTVIGENGPTDTRLFILFLLAVSSTAVAVVFGVAFVTILFSSTRPDVQCPLKRGKTSEAASVEADNVVQWENQSVGCGGAWERELSASLGKK